MSLTAAKIRTRRPATTENIEGLADEQAEEIAVELVDNDISLLLPEQSEHQMIPTSPLSECPASQNSVFSQLSVGATVNCFLVYCCVLRLWLYNDDVFLVWYLKVAGFDPEIANTNVTPIRTLGERKLCGTTAPSEHSTKTNAHRALHYNTPQKIGNISTSSVNAVAIAPQSSAFSTITTTAANNINDPKQLSQKKRTNGSGKSADRQNENGDATAQRPAKRSKTDKSSTSTPNSALGSDPASSNATAQEGENFYPTNILGYRRFKEGGVWKTEYLGETKLWYGADRINLGGKRDFRMYQFYRCCSHSSTACHSRSRISRQQLRPRWLNGRQCEWTRFRPFKKNSFKKRSSNSCYFLFCSLSFVSFISFSHQVHVCHGNFRQMKRPSTLGMMTS